MVEHVDIPDGERHEPKGVGSASAGEAYIADGAGSGSWESSHTASWLCMRRVTDLTTTGMSLTYQVVDNATLGLTYSSSSQSPDITIDLAAGEILVANAGTYHIVVSMALTGVAASLRHYGFTFGIDSGAGVVAQDGFVKTLRSTNNASDSGSAAFACMPTLLAGDKLYLMAKNQSGTVAEITFNHINFTMAKVAG
jgi:hypothetical protein